MSVVSCVPCLQLSQCPRAVSSLETFEDGIVGHVEEFAPAASLALDAVVVGAGTSPRGPVAICAGCGLVGAFRTEHSLGTEVGIWCCLTVYTVVVVALKGFCDLGDLTLVLAVVAVRANCAIS